MPTSKVEATEDSDTTGKAGMSTDGTPEGARISEEHRNEEQSGG
jgi:hypothetical protein